MEFDIEREVILRGLKKIQGITEKSAVVPQTSGMLIEAFENKVVIRATNFEVGIITEHGARVKESGMVVVDARKTFEIFKEMPEGEIHIEKKETGWIEIRHENNILFNIVGITEEEFPKVEIDEKIDFSDIYVKSILELIKSTIYATSYDRTRGALTGILVEKTEETIRMVATDGHRLALAERNILEGERLDIKESVIIPEKGAREIKRLAEEIKKGEKIKIGFGEKSVVVKAEEEMLIVRLIEGDFPNYLKIIPKESKNKIVLRKKELLESLRRIELVADEETRAVKIILKDGNIEISSRKTGIGDAKEDMRVDYIGEKIEMGLNGKYIMDALNVFDDDEVVFGINEERKPILIKGNCRENIIAVIMPIDL